MTDRGTGVWRPGSSACAGAIFEKVEEKKPEKTVCARCGARAPESPPLTWICSVENGDRRYFCEDCSRSHIRAIEGRLDSSWW